MPWVSVSQRLCYSMMTWKEPEAISYSREAFTLKPNYWCLNLYYSMNVDQISHETNEGKGNLKACTISSEWHVILLKVEYGMCSELDTMPWHFFLYSEILIHYASRVLLFFTIFFYCLMCWSFQGLCWTKVDSTKNGGRSSQFTLLLLPTKESPWCLLISAAKLQHILQCFLLL